MKRIIRLSIFGIVALIIGLGGALTWICYLQARLLVLPRQTPADLTPADYGIPNFTDVTFTASDGVQTGGWYVPPTRDDGASIIFIHGHASHRGHFLGRAPLFANWGYGMLFIDLRNAGTSEGDVTTMGLLEALDVEAAFDFLILQSDVNPERIMMYGHSMGGATAIRAFRMIPDARVLIAEAAYSSMEDNVRDRIRQDFPVPPLMFPQIVIGFTNTLSGEDLFEMRPIDDIQNLDGRPVLLIHGTLDPVVPIVSGERLFAAASEPKEFWVIGRCLDITVVLEFP